MHKCLNWIAIFFFSLNFFDHKFTQIRFIFFIFIFEGEFKRK